MDIPQLELLRQGDARESVLLIPGYLTEESGMDAEWMRAIEARGYRGNIYQLKWDSSGMATAVRHGIPMVLAAATDPVLAVVAVGRLRGHWSKVKRRAKRVGRDYLPEMISDVEGERVTVVAHSLGARVAYYALENGLLPPRVTRLVMCGGAVRRDSSKDWAAVAKHLPAGIHNIRNEQDWVLKTFFKAAEGGENPVGSKPIKVKHPRIRDVNATGLLPCKIEDGLGSHSKYYRVLGPSLDGRNQAVPGSNATSAEARKHCRVCGKRIKGGFKFQATRRFSCKGCGHRTHVHCAASVGRKRCGACG